MKEQEQVQKVGDSGHYDLPLQKVEFNPIRGLILTKGVCRVIVISLRGYVGS